MEPYYQDEKVTIYNADCRDVLDKIENQDLMIVDPPYGMNYQSNYRIQKHRKIENDEVLPVELIEAFHKKINNASYVFCRWDNLSQMPEPKSVLVWVKNNWSMGDLKHEHGRQWEAICFYPNSKHEFKCRIPDVIYADRSLNNLHPTEKPLNLIYKIINCNECESIIDPFMGSGTTLRAAKDLGKKAIGIEIDERYCEIAAKRMQQEVLNFN